MSERLPNLFTIEPGDPFLPRLAKAMLDGKLVPGIDRHLSPLQLADVTIFVPTRRAARALRSAFAKELGGASALLPDIRPLGEFDDETFSTSTDAIGSLLPAIGPYERLLALAPLVEGWRSLISNADTKSLYADEAIVLPVSRADAIWLAQELAALIDEAATEGADWSKLFKLEETRDLADWWKLTNQFLNIVTVYWPQYLADIGCIDPATYRSKMIDDYRLSLLSVSKDKVIIAAGSTGSIPATARLLNVIAKMPRGAVVLPGLDLPWFVKGLANQLVPHFSNASSIGHPQYGMAKLLHMMEADQSLVCQLATAPLQYQARREVVSLAMLPASHTHLWAGQKFERGALNGMSLIEAANEREEALAIAVTLRRAIETPNATAALVTPDRMLARRVAAELKRFNIDADDSGGTALTATEPGSFLIRLTEALYGNGDPLSILALIKHPLFCCGNARSKMRDIAENFELYVLRGRNGRPKLGALSQELNEASKDHNDNGSRPRALKLVTKDDLDALIGFAAAFDAHVKPALFEGEMPLSEVLILMVSLLEQAATNHDGSFDRLYANETGQSLSVALRSLIKAGSQYVVSQPDVLGVLKALLSGETVKPRPGGHARVFIWGTLESRLQTVDTVVLGSLNEGSWPSVPEQGPFLSRLMQQEIALEPPERRIGQSAHDFEQLLGLPNVVISRSLRKAGAPSEPARWLQRLLAVAGDEEVADIRGRGDALLKLSRRLDYAPSENLATRPEPKPPLDKRPNQFYVTEIETLRRDPYAVYARKILKLYPLEDLISDPGARERGTLFHEILAEATRRNLDHASPFADQGLLDIANECFNNSKLPDDISALWWPRFSALVPQLVSFESDRRHNSLKRHSEVSSDSVPIGQTGATLSARADRIDVSFGGETVLIDYKGHMPSIADTRALHAPQLALEAALITKGAFQTIGALNVSDAMLVRLLSAGEVKIDKLGTDKRTAEDLGQLAWERLERLVYYYTTQTNGYISRAFAQKQNWASKKDAPYDHLARTYEWSALGSHSDGEDNGDGDE